MEVSRIPKREETGSKSAFFPFFTLFFSFTRVSQPAPIERSPPRSESPPAKPFTLADEYEFTSDEDLERDWADDDIEDSVLEEISILGLNLKRSYGKITICSCGENDHLVVHIFSAN